MLLHTLSALVRLHELKHETARRPSRKEAEIARCKKEIEPALMKKYQILEERFGKSALVQMKKNTCMGCFIQQPGSRMSETAPQIYQCHHCGRLLYHPEDLYEESGF